MKKKIEKFENTIENLISKVPNQHRNLAASWNQAMLNGAVCYGRPIRFDTRRIYLGSANKYWNFIEPDFLNIKQAVIKAIENCRPDQFSTKRHIKESAISLSKYLIQIQEGDNKCMSF